MEPATAAALLDDRWLPKSILCLRDYNRHKFLHDLLAGVTVGLVALPLAMAFAIASGLTPQAGIYCAVVTGFLISALGGSKTQVGGPTGAFVVVVAGIVAAHGIDGLFMCTVMAGVLLIIMGATGLVTVLVLIICRSLSPRIPGPIVALLLGTAAVYLFKLPVETIGTRFGGIPSGLPHLAIPKFRADLIHGLLGPAFAVAMLGAIESLMSAVVSDRMSNDRHYPNVELIGQGVANIFSPMFGGLPATGAIARTATNIRSGAQSPVAGMIHSL